jgi:hypothetical protein
MLLQDWLGVYELSEAVVMKYAQVLTQGFYTTGTKLDLGIAYPQFTMFPGVDIIYVRLGLAGTSSLTMYRLHYLRTSCIVHSLYSHETSRQKMHIKFSSGHKVTATSDGGISLFPQRDSLKNFPVLCLEVPPSHARC